MYVILVTQGINYGYNSLSHHRTHVYHFSNQTLSHLKYPISKKYRSAWSCHHMLICQPQQTSQIDISSNLEEVLTLLSLRLRGLPALPLCAPVAAATVADVDAATVDCLTGWAVTELVVCLSSTAVSPDAADVDAAAAAGLESWSAKSVINHMYSQLITSARQWQSRAHELI